MHGAPLDESSLNLFHIRVCITVPRVKNASLRRGICFMKSESPDVITSMICRTELDGAFWSSFGTLLVCLAPTPF